MKEYNIWSEGFVVMEGKSGAHYHGKIKANSFKEACDDYFKNDSLYDPERMTYWDVNYLIMNKKQENHMVKKLFLLFALVALCSCGPATINNKTEQGILDHFDKVIHFSYKGHKYISFEHSFPAREAAVGIVHDPNCPCHENSN